jgi:hypothetical protein
MMPCRMRGQQEESRVETGFEVRAGSTPLSFGTHVDGPHPDRFRRLGVFFYQLGQP